jgi:hypothetical protein
MTATAGDLLLDADTQLQLRGLDAARPALYRAIDAARQGSRGSQSSPARPWKASRQPAPRTWP